MSNLRMTTWAINGFIEDSRPQDFERLRREVHELDSVMSIDVDESDYIAFHDVYGNKHEYIMDEA